jgi:hypothetical protein
VTEYRLSRSVYDRNEPMDRSVVAVLVAHLGELAGFLDFERQSEAPSPLEMGHLPLKSHPLGA